MCYLSPSNIRSFFGCFNIGKLIVPNFYPSHLKQKFFAWIDKIYFDFDVTPRLNIYRKQIGIDPILSFLPHVQSSANLYLTFFPNWLSPSKEDWPKPMIEVGFFFKKLHSKDSDVVMLDNFLKDKSEPIIFTFGSGNNQESNFFTIAEQAVSRLNKPAIFLTNSILTTSIKNAKNILVLGYFPMELLLRRCSIIVHHGGIGTTADAIKAGLPQLLIPTSHDQFNNARIVTELGIGKDMSYESLNCEALVGSLNQLEGSSDIKANCYLYSKKIISNINQSFIIDKVLDKLGA
jgi:rhamnosyltransferase subunit B